MHQEFPDGPVAKVCALAQDSLADEWSGTRSPLLLQLEFTRHSKDEESHTLSNWNPQPRQTNKY